MLAAPLVLALVAGMPATAAVLVSNIGQPDHQTGGLESYDQAQAFTTGDNTAGYTITSIEVEFSRVGANATYAVGIWSSDEEVNAAADTDTLHEPHARLGALTCPTLTVSTSDAVYDCTTSGINLAANTTYVWVIDSSSTTRNSIRNASTDAEDSGAASGWNIANDSLFRDRDSTGGWEDWPHSKKIRINGTAKTALPNVLTSNLSETTEGGVSGTTSNTGQLFHVGDNTGGYTITGIVVESGDAQGHGFDVKVCTEDDSANEYPTTDCTDFTAPSGFAAGNVIFTHTGMPVAPDTNYVIVADPRGTDTVDFAYTASESQSGESDWSIKNKHYFNVGGNWGTTAGNARALKVAVQGTTRSNTAATGKPTITGTARVGQTLTAAKGDVADVDGVPDTLSYQWIRVDNGDNDISGETDSTYELVAADQGKQVKVKVSFTDKTGNSESRTSDAYPSGGTIDMRGPLDHCNASDMAELWCSSMTVGTRTAGGNTFFGYHPPNSLGSLSPSTFDYRTATISVNAFQYQVGGDLSFEVVRSAGTTPSDGLLGAKNFSLEIGTGGSKKTFAINNPGTTVTHTFSNPGLSWSDADTVPVKLLIVNSPATGKPAITGTARVGETLTAAKGTIADTNGLTSPTYTYQWIRVDSGDTAITGETQSTYTLTAADQGKQVKVKVSFTDDDGYSESRESDAYPSGGTVEAALPSSMVSNLGQTQGITVSLDAHDRAQEFTSGTVSGGYVLEAVQLRLKTDSGTTSTPTVKIYSGSANGTLMATLTGPSALEDGTTGNYAFTGSVRLRTSTKYWIVVESISGVDWATTLSSIEDGGRWAGWSIGNNGQFRDAGGNNYSDVTPTMMISVGGKVAPSVANSTGKPAITAPNVFRVPAVLSVDLSGIADTDGVTNIATNATYKWQRFASNGTRLEVSSLGTASTYTLVNADAGKTIKVQVSFTDDAGNSEGPLTSDATSQITAAATCTAPTYAGGATQIWTGRVTVGTGGVFTGYSASSGYGALDVPTFSAGGDNYTIQLVHHGSDTGRFLFQTNSPLNAAEREKIGLHVCDTDFTLNSAQRSSVGSSELYSWTVSGRDWTTHAERTLYLSRDAVAPTVSSATVYGTSVVITFSEDLGAAASLTNTAFTVERTRGGSEATAALSTTAPAIAGNTVTLTLTTAAAILATDTGVKVTYNKPGSGTNNKLVDGFGNEAATFTDQSVTILDPPPAQVTGVSVTALPGRLQVDWTAVSGADGYKVQWKSGAESYSAADRQEEISSGATVRAIISPLVGGTSYTVRVIATKSGANDGAPSAEATGTPTKAAPRFWGIANFGGGGRVPPNATVTGLIVVYVDFPNMPRPYGPVGVSKSDLVVPRGRVLSVRTFGQVGSATRIQFNVEIHDPPNGGNALSLTFSADAITQGNTAATWDNSSLNYTTAPPLTITLTHNATEPATRDFLVSATFSVAVNSESGSEPLVAGAIPAPSSVSPSHADFPFRVTNGRFTRFASDSGSLSGFGNLPKDPPISFIRFQVRPRTNFEGITTICVPLGRLAPSETSGRSNTESCLNVPVNTRRSSVSSDATLSALTLTNTADSSTITLTPTTFLPTHTEYDASVPNSVSQITVTPTTTHGSAAVEYLDGTDANTAPGHQVDLAVGETVITITVTAEDGTTETYTVTATRAPPPMQDATLKSLTVTNTADSSTITLNPTFRPTLRTYTASVPNTVMQVTVAAMPNNAGATVEYLDGTDAMLTDANATNGHQVDLEDEGATVIKVKVTAQDGTTQTYTVTVTRRAAVPPRSDLQPLLRQLTLSEGTLSPSLTPDTRASIATVPGGVSLSPSFTPDTHAYTATVTGGVSLITVTPTTAGNATVAYFDGSETARTDADPDTPGWQVALAVGENVIDLRVSAQGRAEARYRVTVTRLADMPVGLRAVPGDGQVTLQWEAPASDGGAAITEYEYRFAAGTSVPETTAWISVGEVLMVTIPDLTNGTDYTFEVRAVYRRGRGTAASVSATPAAAPGAPERLAATPGHRQVTLEWEAPASDGGAAILRYEYRSDRGAWMDAGTALTATVTGLIDSRPYLFEVRAVNAVGAGEAAEVTVTVGNYEEVTTAWLARFGRTIGTHVTDLVGERMRAPAGQEAHVTIGGYRLPLNRRAGAGRPGKDALVPGRATAPAPNALSPGGRGEGEGDESASALATKLWGELRPAPISADGAEPQGRLAAVVTEVATLLGLGGVFSGARGEDAGPPTEPGRDPWLDGPATDPRLGRSSTLAIRLPSLRQALLGSSFRVNLADTDDAVFGAQRVTAWGRVGGTQFSGREGTLGVDGDVLQGAVGVDGTWDRMLVGLAVAHSQGTGAFNGAETRGDLAQNLTSLHPYLHYQLTDRLAAWGVVGYGWGELTVEAETGRAVALDTDFMMGAFGGRGVLLAAKDNAGFEVATRTDLMLTRMTSDAVLGLDSAAGNAHRLRAILEATRPVTWPEGRSLIPSASMGLRHDWGDAETGFGLELGGRVQYTDPRYGLTVEAAVRGLLAHEDSAYQEWGGSGTIRVDPGAAGQGLSLTLAPTWGAAASGVEGLWSRETTAGLAPQGPRASPAGRLNAEVGYGVDAPGGMGLLTPYAGTVLADGADRTYRVGARLRLNGSGAMGLAMNLEGIRQEPAGAQPVNQGLRFQVTWGF